MSYISDVSIKDSADVDAFSRLRVSEPLGLFDAQFTYNLKPLQYEAVTNGSGATVTHDSTNRCALHTFSSTPTGGKAFMQSYEYIRYQPGRSQAAFVTFNFIETNANTTKFAGLSDGTNGIELQQVGSTVQLVIYSGTSNGTQTVAKSAWNIDKFDGTGPSGITLDLTKTQILIIDLQALYVGRVRVGFDVNGVMYYAHQFLHANVASTPYIQYATLPIRCGMTCTGTATTTMRFVCSAVISEGGQEDTTGVNSGIEGTATAASGVDTHILSVRPKTTFNSITNRTKFVLGDMYLLVTGNSPVIWKIVIGQAISGTTTFADVNATHSAFEYNTAGTASGSPSVIIHQGYCSSSNQTKGDTNAFVYNKIPITLNAAGAVRADGTLSLLVQGVGGASACRASFNWSELR
jgi:hypothetical protein